MLAEADQTPASETSPAIGIVTLPAGCEYLSLD
jgi:hypothetical protein